MREHREIDVYDPANAVISTTGATTTVVSHVIPVSHIGARAFRVDLTVTGVTVAAGITAKLQHASPGATTWSDVKSVAITTAGEYTIALLDTVAADQPYLPLRPEARVVIVSGNGDKVTITKVVAVQ